MPSISVLISGFGISCSLSLSALLLFFAGAALMSVSNVAFRGGMPIGSAVAGFLIKASSAPLIMATNGVLVVLRGTLFLFMQRRVAKA